MENTLPMSGHELRFLDRPALCLSCFGGGVREVGHEPLKLRCVSRSCRFPHPLPMGAVMGPDQAVGSTRLQEGCLRSAKQIAAFATSLQSSCVFSYPSPLSDKTVCLSAVGFRVHKIPL
jgi:hypothetical protein